MKKEMPTIVALFFFFALSSLFNCEKPEEKDTIVLNDYIQDIRVDERRPEFRDLKQARVIVNQSYSNSEKTNLPFSDIAVSLLHHAGIDTVQHGESGQDLVVRVDVTGRALGARYMGSLSGYKYTGATIDGTFSIQIGDSVLHQDAFNAEIPVPSSIQGSAAAEPSGAPFKRALARSGYPVKIATIFGGMFGPRPLIATLLTETSGIAMPWYTIGLYPGLFEVIGDLQDPRSAPMLIGLLHRVKSHWKVATLVDAMGHTKDPSGVPPLIPLMKHKSWHVRRAAATALGNVGDPAATEALIAKLRDRNRDVVRGAVTALGKIKDPRSVEPILDVLRNEEYWYMRDDIVAALSGHRDAGSVQTLIAGLAEYPSSIWIVRALGEIGNPAAVEPMVWLLLNTEKSSLIYDITKALGKIGNDQALQALIGCLDHADASVRDNALEALKESTGENFEYDKGRWVVWLEGR